ncbi:MAG: hypothetical protein ACE5HU_09220 [Acidobacteriota bacterium]
MMIKIKKTRAARICSGARNLRIAAEYGVFDATGLQVATLRCDQVPNRLGQRVSWSARDNFGDLIPKLRHVRGFRSLCARALAHFNAEMDT